MVAFFPQMLRIALFQPDFAPNVGAVIRTAACFDVAVDIIEPCGFPFSNKAVRDQALDYGAQAEVIRHASWSAYCAARTERLIAMTTQGASGLWDLTFQPGDTILMGRESAGLPPEAHAAADARVRIPMAAGVRSLNMATAAAIAMAEALRQLQPARPSHSS